MTNEKLRVMAAKTIRAYLNRASTKKRLLLFADTTSSFEGWLNWELAWAFRQAYPWPKFTAQREVRYEGRRALADIRYYMGPERGSTAECFLETKLVWNNSNRSKQMSSAANDAKFLAKHRLSGLVLVVSVSALQTNEWVKLEDAKTDLIAETEARIRRAAGDVAVKSTIVLETAARASQWYLKPMLRAALFDVG